MEQIRLKKILIIDDDNISILLITRILKLFSPEIQVSSFTDPCIALQHILDLKTEDFNALNIFLDLYMPVLNGWDVLDQLNQHFGDKLPANAGIYILSSSAMNTDIIHFKSYEMVKGFLTKPLELDLVKEILA